MATIDKRGCKYRARVRRRGYPDQIKSFSSRADAEVWVRAVEGEMDRGAFIDRSEAETTTLKTALTRYDREVTTKKKGKKSEQYRIQAWIAHPLAARVLASIRSSDIAEHRDARLAEGRAPQTVINEINLLSHLFEIARKEWGIPVENPCKHVRKPTRREGRDRRLLPGEEVRLLASATPQLKQFIVVAIETAMRRGELNSLSWEWIDLKRRVATLPDTKNGTRRAVPLSSRAVAALEAMAAMTAVDASQEGEGGDEPERTGRVFGWALDGGSISHAFRDACEMAGIEGLRLHDLRHEATSRLVESGKFNMIEIASITGHKTMVMLQRYSHPRAEDLAARLG